MLLYDLTDNMLPIQEQFHAAYKANLIVITAKFYTAPTYLDDYRKAMCVKDGKLATFSDLRVRAIRAPIAQLLKHSNGQWVTTDPAGLGYELERDGKTVTHITLKLKPIAPVVGGQVNADDHTSYEQMQQSEAV